MKMKSYYPLMMAAVLVACGPAGDKKAELEKLRADYAALGQQISALEKELAVTDTVVAGKAVRVEALKAGDFTYFIETQAGVEAEENIMVSSRAAGIVTAVYVKEGQAVRAGMVLAQIDNSLTQKAIAELQGSLDLARTVYDRQKALWDQKIGTEIQFLTARNNKESLEKRMSSLQEQDEFSRIRSAIAGTVDDVMIKVGEVTAPGAPAARVVNTRKLKISANLSESYISQVATGSPAKVTLSEGAINFDSKVSFTGKNINPLSRSFNIEIPVPASVDARPGMSARIRIDFKKVAGAVSVPVNLVQRLNGEQVVYTAEQQGKGWVARRKVVATGGIYGNRAEILNGLKAGEHLITVAYQGLNDGEPVNFPAEDAKN